MRDRITKAHQYTESDIHVLDDPIAVIRKRPGMYVRSNPVSGAELATNLVGDALLLTGGRVTAFRNGAWWIVACDADWMTSEPGLSVDALFSRIVPFPQAGTNSMHSEVLLAAFAHDIVVKGAESCAVIKGNVPPAAAVWTAVTSNQGWKRVVAFRLP